MKKNILLLIVFSLLIFGNLYEENKYEKVSYSVSNPTNYTIGTSTKSDGDYVERIVVRVELDYETKKVESNDINTLKAANDEKNRIRIELKEHHSRKNDKYFDDLDVKYYDTSYICSYSPHIEFEYYKNDFLLHQDEILNGLNNNEIVKNISVMEYDASYEEYLTYVMNDMGLGTIYTNRTYTGSGVTIGLLESGIIDKNDPNISGSNFTIHNQLFVIEKVDDHTTTMAQIIAGNHGIAKNAHLLNSFRFGSMSNEIEWMIDNGVDVINMSFGLGNKGTYDDYSAYVDYIVKTYGVLVCVASGNSNEDNNEYVDNPGLAYNALSIGAASETNDINNYSCYQVSTGANKPNIVVQGEGVNIPNTSYYATGTSVACAIATGTIALLFEKFPGLMGKPAQTMAIINASCKSYPTYTSRLNNGYNDYLGAGEFMFDRACEAYYTIRWITVGSHETNLTVHSADLQMTVGQTIKVAIVRLVHATGDASETAFSDYDLYFLSSGIQVESTTSIRDNVEIIEYTATQTGIHTIRINKFQSETTENELVAIAYYLE